MNALGRVNPIVHHTENERYPKQGSWIFIALLWILGVCVCASEMMQNWVYDISNNDEIQQLVLMKMNSAYSKEFVMKHHHHTQPQKNQDAIFVNSCINPVKKNMDFAIVSTIESKDEHEKNGAIALGKSIQAWQLNVDLILLVFVNENLLIDNNTLNHYETTFGEKSGIGWHICLMDISNLPMDVRLRAWALIEYKAVVIMEKDTLIVGDISSLFSLHYNAILMQKQKENATSFPLGAMDRRFTPCEIKENKKFDISTGILLIIPNFTEYLRLKKKALQLLSTDKSFHYIQTNFRSLLRNHFEDPKLQYSLPSELNANIAWKFCNPQWWLNADIKILHFTIAKPWNFNDKQTDNNGGWNGFTNQLMNTHWNANHPWACWLTGTEDLCMFWKSCLNVKEPRLNHMAFCWATKYNYKKNTIKAFM